MAEKDGAPRPRSTPRRSRGEGAAADGAAPPTARGAGGGAQKAAAAGGGRARAPAGSAEGRAAGGRSEGGGTGGVPRPDAGRGAGARPGVADAPRRPELELRPVASLVSRLTRPAFRRRSPAGATLMSDWPALVGPQLAAVTVPLRLTRGTLTIGCSGPMAMELQHLGPQLMARINASLGAVAVEALRFVQQAPLSAAPPAPRRPSAPAVLPEAVVARLDGVADPALRAALERLARGVYRKR